MTDADEVARKEEERLAKTMTRISVDRSRRASWVPPKESPNGVKPPQPVSMALPSAPPGSWRADREQKDREKRENDERERLAKANKIQEELGGTKSPTPALTRTPSVENTREMLLAHGNNGTASSYTRPGTSRPQSMIQRTPSASKVNTSYGGLAALRSAIEQDDKQKEQQQPGTLKKTISMDGLNRYTQPEQPQYQQPEPVVCGKCKAEVKDSFVKKEGETRCLACFTADLVCDKCGSGHPTTAQPKRLIKLADLKWIAVRGFIATENVEKVWEELRQKGTLRISDSDLASIEDAPENWKDAVRSAARIAIDQSHLRALHENKHLIGESDVVNTIWKDLAEQCPVAE